MPEPIRAQQKAHLVRLKILEVGGGGGDGGRGDCLLLMQLWITCSCLDRLYILTVEISWIIAGNTELELFSSSVQPHHCFEL